MYTKYAWFSVGIKDWISKSSLFMYTNDQTSVKWCQVFIQVNYSLDCTAMDSAPTIEFATFLWMVLAPAIKKDNTVI